MKEMRCCEMGVPSWKSINQLINQQSIKTHMSKLWRRRITTSGNSTIGS